MKAVVFLVFFKQRAQFFLLIWIIILAILYSTLSILRHNHFESGGFDLGLYDQEVWQYSRFLWPYNTIKDRFILGDHLNLTTPLLAPLYWIWNDVRMLLLFQAFTLSFSALAIYQLACLRKFTKFNALLLSIIYSLFYGLQFAVFTDFHAVALGVGLLPWIAYFLEKGQRKLLITSIVLLLLSQENLGLALAGLGLIYLFHQKFRRTAGVFIITGSVASLISAKAVALMSPAGFQYWPQISLNFLEVIRQFFDSEEKRQVWFYSFAWFSFLPLLSPGAVLAVALDLAQYFVTGPEFSRMWSPFMHHRAILGPFLVLGTLDGLAFIKSKIGKIDFSKNAIAQIKKSIFPLIPILLLISAMVQQYGFHFPLNKLTKADYWKEEQWMRDDRTLIAQVPQDASVATQQNLVPHLSQRKEIYLVYPRPHDFDDNRCGQRSCWWLDFAGKPQYLVVDLRPDQWLTQILESNEHFDSAVANMEKAGKIVLESEINSAKLYKIIY